MIFSSVRMADDAKLVVSLHRVFEQRSEKLLEKLTRHLKQRLPELEQLLYEAKSPPVTRTIVL